MLEIKELRLELGNKKILDKISFSVTRGEFVAIVGPNGAGKSSLIKCINRIYSNYEGDVFLNAKQTSRLSSKTLAQNMAYVPQIGEIPLDFTVRQFVEQGHYPWRNFFGRQAAHEIYTADDAMRLSGAAGLSGRLLGSLSGGERQKVLIAAALAQSAPLLLMDEPTTYLDYRHQVETAELIRFIHKIRGHTVLAVTHDLNFALQLAQRIIVLAQGTLVWEGLPGHLTAKGLLEKMFGTQFLRFETEYSPIPFVVPASFSAKTREELQGDFR